VSGSGRVGRLATVACMMALVAACDREHRAFRGAAEPAPRVEQQSQLRPGLGATTVDASLSKYNGNAWAIAEGKRLYTQFNCAGCHANGGGGIGPALMDDDWIYGFGGASIFATIVEGRPNGMPSFRGKIAEDQVWQIVAYVEAMSGHAPLDSLPGRTDHMAARPPENATPATGRRQTGHR
jgi:cytochrome c oxidase cbb3-type subunit III